MEKIIIGNWKMNLPLHAAVSLAEKIHNGMEYRMPYHSLCEMGIAPDFTSIAAVQRVAGKFIRIGAQNIHHELGGAFTGEVSLDMLTAIACDFVIIGHSERRTLFFETNAIVNKKVLTSIKRLRTILCIGETLAERRDGHANAIIKSQLAESLMHVSEADSVNNLTIAYEPVWAIGTGQTASPDQAEEIHALIRVTLGEIFSTQTAETVPVIYGGSVNRRNAESLLSMPNIDGALIGGASLNENEFLEIFDIACQTTNEQ